MLLYLGFTGDTYFGDFIQDDAHWRRAMAAYLKGVVPRDWIGTTVAHPALGESVTLLIGSLPVTGISKADSATGEVLTEPVDIIEPAVLIRVSRAYRPEMSDLELNEATRGVWKIGPRREQVRYALAVHQGVVLEVYEIDHWQAAWTANYTTRNFEDTAVKGRSEFVGRIAPEAVRHRYRGKSVAHYFKRGAQNPITYAPRG